MQRTRDIIFEVTLKCNLNCAMCSRQFLRDKTSELDFDLAKEIIDDIGKNRSQPIRLSIGGYGEPLLYPRLPELIALMKSKLPGVYVSLVSNGHFLSEALGKSLLDVGLDYIRLSLNATCAEEYERLMGSSKFQQVEDKIRGFFTIRDAHPFKAKIGLQILDTKINQQNYEEYKRKWEPLLRGEDFITYRKMENRGGAVNADSLSGVESEAIPSLRYPCYALWHHVVLDTIGNVYCCCEAYTFREKPGLLRIGNVKDNSITDIMNSSRLHEVQEMHLTGDYSRLPECAVCNKIINYPNLWQWQGERWVLRS